MQQVSHRDPRMTMRAYAKVCARRDRALQGAAFDRLLDPQRDDRQDDIAAWNIRPKRKTDRNRRR